MTDENKGLPTNEGIELPTNGDQAFAALMGVLAPEPDEPKAPAGGETPPTPTTGDGSSAAPVQGGEPGAPQPAAPPAGDEGGAGVPAGTEPKPDGDQPAGDAGTPEPAGAADSQATGVGTLDPVALEPKWGEVLAGLESKQTEVFTSQAVETIRTEYAGYIDKIEQPSRALVGQKVPSVADPEVMETLRDSQDAKDWQDNIRQALGREVRDRVSRSQDGARDLMETLHNSVGLFQNNPDLIPQTKTFDKELADKFVELAKPYEVRIDNKLVGYNVPVQGMLTQLRQQIVAGRVAAGKPAVPTPQQERAGQQERTPAGQFSGPQAGIPNKAGASGDSAEDLSTLFGTIGLPDFRI